MQLFGTSGVRRLVDSDLIQLSLRVSMAVGSIYHNVVIGRDTRTSGNVLFHAVTSGLLAAGANCYDAGVLPTPTLAFATKNFDAGIMITASHNPPQYNGLKLLNPDGSAFSSEQQKQIEDMVSGLSPINVRWDIMKVGGTYSEAEEKHVTKILQDFPQKLHLKIVVDSGCGAAYHITPYLLEKMGCEVIQMNCHANGIFPHDVEPVEANLGDLMRMVKESGSDLGIAHDGDADRMMAIDDLGRFITGDKLLAIFALESGNKDIVTTIDASMYIEQMSFNVRRTKVGDPYISEELKKGGVFGGETSGAWVFPQISLCPDGIYAAAKIAVIAGGKKLSEFANSIPAYPLFRSSIPAKATAMANIKQKLVSRLKPISINEIDGLKLNLKDGWILIRPSGTEPKIRLTVEAKSESLAHTLHIDALKIIQECV